MSRLRQAVNARSRERVPPGQAFTTKFPMLHMGDTPAFDPRTRTLKKANAPRCYS
jgi:hypothetical protein